MEVTIRISRIYNYDRSYGVVGGVERQVVVQPHLLSNWGVATIA
jgi:hypothetical protein